MFCFFYFQTVPTSSPFLACNLFKNLQKIQKRVLRADKDHTNSLTLIIKDSKCVYYKRMMDVFYLRQS